MTLLAEVIINWLMEKVISKCKMVQNELRVHQLQQSNPAFMFMWIYMVRSCDSCISGALNQSVKHRQQLTNDSVCLQWRGWRWWRLRNVATTSRSSVRRWCRGTTGERNNRCLGYRDVCLLSNMMGPDKTSCGVQRQKLHLKNSTENFIFRNHCPVTRGKP